MTTIADLIEYARLSRKRRDIREMEAALYRIELELAAMRAAFAE